MRAHVAQLNIATLTAPLADDAITEFREGLGPVNAAGEAAEGFVWRLQTDDGDATAIRVSDDPLSIINLTVWQSIDALRRFAYGGMHRDFLRRRNEWFTDVGRRTAVWHVPAGTLPTVHEALRRVAFIEHFGESPYAYTSVASSRASDRPTLVIAEHPLTAEDSQQLIAELNVELQSGSAPGEVHHFELTDEQVVHGQGQFVVAWLDGVAVGCGAFRMIGDGTAEIKRMYVRPTARGHKIGAAVLHDLETRAAAHDARRLALETAPRLTAAVSLYGKAGFSPCPCWGDYAGTPHNVCFDKVLA
jgi:GNAT superfamily N-acetyltransferase